MHVAMRQFVYAMVAVGMFVVPGVGSAEEVAQVSARQQAQTGEKSAVLAQFEKDVAKLRVSLGGPATPAITGRRLNVVSPSTLLDGRVSTEVSALQAFVVWLQNSSPSALTTVLYWTDTTSSTVHQTGAGVSPGQVAPHITSDCGTVVAYILEIYQNGVLIASTGIAEPNGADGDLCADAWEIQ